MQCTPKIRTKDDPPPPFDSRAYTLDDESELLKPNRDTHIEGS